MVGYAGVSDGSLEIMANASVGMTCKSEEKEGRGLGASQLRIHELVPY